MKSNKVIICLVSFFLIMGKVIGGEKVETINNGGKEYHVSISGSDENDGFEKSPFRTISAASIMAQPGDSIIVHWGIYRESINPPRGGNSDGERIVYKAAKGEKVVITGSEQITGWEELENETWVVKLPNTFFGDFNPYSDLIKGDWFQASQAYHTGAVYVNGHWLKQASLKSILIGNNDVGVDSRRDLMNVELLRVPDFNTVYATDVSSQSSSATVIKLSDGKSCLGPVKGGDRLVFENVDFRKGANSLILSTGSPVGGGFVEVRKGTADGELLCQIDAGLTAEWTHFQSFKGKLNQTLSGKQTIVLIFKERPLPPFKADDAGFWFAEVDEDFTTIWAQFKKVNPNEALVEINVRQSVFYPKETGRDYITVSGFTLEQAATPWSPPTAEQIGLIGTNWSKGWIIENNLIRYSTCTGITLGKHGDEFDNTHDYYRSIEEGLKNGWSRDNIGGHLVRNNHILNCGQAGIVGSLGAAFSTIIGNEVHDIRKNH